MADRGKKSAEQIEEIVYFEFAIALNGLPIIMDRVCYNYPLEKRK